MRGLRTGLFRAWLGILLPTIFIAPAKAQTTSTEILGLVTDTSGSVVPGAKVTITRVATGETRTVETNAAGEYSFPLIEIGDYNVRVTMEGFKAQTVTGLHVELQQKARVNLTLEVGQVTESIEVSAQAIALKTEDASVGQVIENKRIIEHVQQDARCGRGKRQQSELHSGAQNESRCFQGARSVRPNSRRDGAFRL